MATQAMLDEARAAYHRIVTGKGVAEARGADGRTVKWHPGNLAELRTYISGLEKALGVPSMFARTRGRRVLFG
ncbi:gpW family head-tail joining protein [Methylobacterium oryzihabitans]|uniref:Phage tail protein n=1 Tax=Methylobacterium oryzihabitans TaxID=2499852 RepID=A0A3S2YKJ9_9HYPH|nr:gpW family head-tail joining protein [Methylobacterium oryzihabitans]RVU13154.1 phage tail protein [Methylobacterium oryzihabitans]